MTIALRPVVDGQTALEWTRPDGYTALLDEPNGYMPLWGQSNFRAPPVSVTTSPLPRKGGSVIKHARRLERQLTLPILIRGATEAELDDRIDQLAAWFDPTRGDGIITITRADGTQRQAAVRYTGGLELTEETGDARGFSYVSTVLEFLMPDPLWKDVVDSTATLIGLGTARPFLGEPFLPLRLTPGHVAMFAAVINSGSAEAWPVWTIPGPGTNPIIRNLTTGEQLLLGITLSPTQILTVDTRGDRPAITDQGGHWLNGSVLGGSTMFALVPGSNLLQIEIDENTEGATVELLWRRQWMSM